MIFRHQLLNINCKYIGNQPLLEQTGLHHTPATGLIIDVDNYQAPPETDRQERPDGYPQQALAIANFCLSLTSQLIQHLHHLAPARLVGITLQTGSHRLPGSGRETGPGPAAPGPADPAGGSGAGRRAEPWAAPVVPAGWRCIRN